MIQQFRVWPDGTVQSLDDGEEPYTWLSDDSAVVWARSPDEADQKVNGQHRNPVTYALLLIAVVPLALMYFYIQPVIVSPITCVVMWWMAVSLCSFFVYLFRNVKD